MFSTLCFWVHLPRRDNLSKSICCDLILDKVSHQTTLWEINSLMLITSDNKFLVVSTDEVGRLVSFDTHRASLEGPIESGIWLPTAYRSNALPFAHTIPAILAICSLKHQVHTSFRALSYAVPIAWNAFLLDIPMMGTIHFKYYFDCPL